MKSFRIRVIKVSSWVEDLMLHFVMGFIFLVYIIAVLNGTHCKRSIFAQKLISNYHSSPAFMEEEKSSNAKESKSC